MKRLRSYMVIIAVVSPAMAIGVLLAGIGFCFLFEGKAEVNIAVTIMFNIIASAIFLAVWLICRKFDRDHWIEYGDGKIVIHRYSKIVGERASKMQIRQTEFLLEEMELYGPSLRVLGKNVELSVGGPSLPFLTFLNSEVFFQLKDGRRISFYVHYFGRFQQAELNRYIYGETGIETTLHKLDLK